MCGGGGGIACDAGTARVVGTPNRGAGIPDCRVLPETGVRARPCARADLATLVAAAAAGLGPGCGGGVDLCQWRAHGRWRDAAVRPTRFRFDNRQRAADRRNPYEDGWGFAGP